MPNRKKILYVATVDMHINAFHLPYLKMMHDEGYEVHVATNGKEQFANCDKKHQISITRSPFHLSNFKAIKQLRKIINEENFDIIHCHTPMGSVVARIAAKKARKNGTRVIYTAHGFHFYKGAPLVNWLLFYPIEKHLAKYTDTLITINQEDYNRAQKKFSKRCKDIEYVPGVGVDTKKFSIKMNENEKQELRKELEINNENFIILCVGRLDNNKNQGFLIESMPEILKKQPKAILLLAGKDELNGKYQKLAKKLNVDTQVKFLGRRNDIPQLLYISDLVVSVSKREGLPVNILEAAQMKKNIIATACRGINDLTNYSNIHISDEKNFINTFSSKYDEANRQQQIADTFSVEHIQEEHKRIYLKEEYHSNKNTSKSQITLSIIIPVYDVEKYLEECFYSIFNGMETRNDYEIILVDDGSTDASGKICDKCAKGKKNIIVLHKQNGGLASARNAGYSLASGKYVTFVDADDRLYTKSLKPIMNQLAHEETDLYFMNIEKFFPDGTVEDMHENIQKEKLHKKSKRECIEYLSTLEKFPAAAGSKIYKKSVLDKHGIVFPKENRVSEDMPFSYEVLYYASSFDKIEIPYYQYRKGRVGSITSKPTIKSFNGLKQFIIEKGQDDNPQDIIQQSLYSFIAYEYSILLWIYSQLSQSEKESELPFLKKYKWILKYTKVGKIKVIYILSKIVGIRITSKIVLLIRRSA